MLAVLFASTIQPGMGLAEMMDSLTAALSNPFTLMWTERTPQCILLFLLAYGMGIGIYWSTRRNYRRGEEHGSAAWGDATVFESHSFLFRNKCRQQRGKVTFKDTGFRL